MKKIININFQGRVLPIEESAYDMLKEYIDSLRRHFLAEEGGAEIINDIESRIAELFNDKIRHGSNCVTEADVQEVIASIGRPEELEAEQDELPGSATGGSYQHRRGNQNAGPRGRFFRNEDDKVLGGVCSGIANYLGLDPAIVRVIFVLLFGALFWVYILLWIIVPAQSVKSNITRRLFRNPDDKVIGGVCGGLAAYFRTESWVIRLVFALPFVLGLLTSGLYSMAWDWDWSWGFGPTIFSGSLGSTLFICYIVLWLAVPYATTAADKLEMKGERVDLNSIRDKVKDGLESLKGKAESWGREVEDAARRFSNSAAAEARSQGPAMRRRGSDLGRVTALLVKVFLVFIAGSIAIGLFGALIGLLFGGMAVFPLTNLILVEPWHHWLAWGGLILLLGMPLLGLITWIVRMISGRDSRSSYVGYVLFGLWLAGVVALVTVSAFIAQDFRTRASVEEVEPMTQPSKGKLYLTVKDDYRSRSRIYKRDWFGDWDEEDAPIYGVTRDSLFINNVRVEIAKSSDSLFHMYKLKSSRSETLEDAKMLAGHIRFDVAQTDSVIHMPRGFVINSTDKFRNQQVMVVIEVPVGGRIELDDAIDDYDWFHVRLHRKRYNVYRGHRYHYKTDREYIMTPEGLELVDGADDSERASGADSGPVNADTANTTLIL